MSESRLNIAAQPDEVTDRLTQRPPENDEIIKAFLQHVVRGEKAQAEVMIKQHAWLLTSRGVVTDYSACTMEGTALGMALSIEDIYIDSKCYLLQILPPDNPLTPLASDYIKSQTIKNHSLRSAYVRCADKLFYIDKTNDQYIELTLDQGQIQSFDIGMSPQLQPRLLDKAQLEKVGLMTGHYHEEEMAEMIMRYLKQQPDGEQEISKQISEQFPEGWEIQENARKMRDSNALKKLFAAIATKNLDEFDADIQDFHDYLDHEIQGIFKTGKRFNSHLLEEAVDFIVSYGVSHHLLSDDPAYQFLYNNIIGYIQRFFPSSYAQAVCQGVVNYVNGNEKLRRSFTDRYNYNQEIIPTKLFAQYCLYHQFFPLDSDPKQKLGRDFAFALMSWAGAVHIKGGTQGQLFTKKLCEAKDQQFENLLSRQHFIPRISPS